MHTHIYKHRGAPITSPLVAAPQPPPPPKAWAPPAASQTSVSTAAEDPAVAAASECVSALPQQPEQSYKGSSKGVTSEVLNDTSPHCQEQQGAAGVTATYSHMPAAHHQAASKSYSAEGGPEGGHQCQLLPHQHRHHQQHHTQHVHHNMQEQQQQHHQRQHHMQHVHHNLQQQQQQQATNAASASTLPPKKKMRGSGISVALNKSIMSTSCVGELLQLVRARGHSFDFFK